MHEVSDNFCLGSFLGDNQLEIVSVWDLLKVGEIAKRKLSKVIILMKLV